MSETKSKNTIIKDTISLCLITLIAGLALGFVYELTKGPIAEAQLQEKRAAYKVVFEGAKSFDDKENEYVDVKDTSKALLEEAGIEKTTITEVLEATGDNGEVLGYVLSVQSVGYGGEVPITIGITTDGTIKNIEVLENQESPGFGANASQPEFKGQFANKKADSIVFVKSGASAENEINAITGATITTTAVTNAVNGALYYVNNCIQQ